MDKLRGLVGTVAAVGALAIIGAAGYNAVSASAQEEPAVQILAVKDLAALKLPLDDYIDGANNPGFGRYTQAQARLTNKCLGRFGYAPWMPETQTPPDALNPGHAHAWGVTAVDDVTRYGYHLPSAPPPAQRTAVPEASPPPSDVVFGEGKPTARRGEPVPVGGCNGEAVRALAAGIPAGVDLDYGRQLVAAAASSARQDSRVRALDGAWSDCMARNGHRYSDPWKANDDEAWRTDGPSAREIAVAEADVACKVLTNYTTVRASVLLAYQRQVIGRNSGRLAVLRAALDQRLRNSEAALTTK